MIIDKDVQAERVAQDLSPLRLFRVLTRENGRMTVMADSVRFDYGGICFRNAGRLVLAIPHNAWVFLDELDDQGKEIEGEFERT